MAAVNPPYPVRMAARYLVGAVAAVQAATSSWLRGCEAAAVTAVGPPLPLGRHGCKPATVTADYDRLRRMAARYLVAAVAAVQAATSS